jgi:hypothetical protein
MDTVIDAGKHRGLVARYVIETGETDPLQRGIAAQRRIERDRFGMYRRDASARRARGRHAFRGGGIAGAGSCLRFGGDIRLRVSGKAAQNGSEPITVVRCIRRRSGSA